MGDTQIFGLIFIDSIKPSDEGILYKSRLEAQNYGDWKPQSPATKTPTVQRFTERLVLSLAAFFIQINPYTRDIIEVYTQSRSYLERNVYIGPPSEAQLPPGKVLKVVKPLYGIPESGLHWYLTDIDHLGNNLGICRSHADSYALYRHDEKN